MKRSQVSIVFGLLNLRERTGVSLVGQRIYTPLELFVRTNSDNFSRSFRRQAFGKWFNDLVENCRVHVLIITHGALFAFLPNPVIPAFSCVPKRVS